MNKEEFIGKLQMVYVGDRNAFDEIVEDNQKLKKEHNITDIKLLDENNRLKNIIDELEKWIEEHKQYQLISERYIVWEDKLVNKLKALKENNK